MKSSAIKWKNFPLLQNGYQHSIIIILTNTRTTMMHRVPCQMAVGPHSNQSVGQSSQCNLPLVHHDACEFDPGSTQLQQRKRRIVSSSSEYHSSPLTMTHPERVSNAILPIASCNSTIASSSIGYNGAPPTPAEIIISSPPSSHGTGTSHIFPSPSSLQTISSSNLCKSIRFFESLWIDSPNRCISFTVGATE